MTWSLILVASGFGIQVGPHRARVGLTIDLDREVGRLCPSKGTWCESQSVSDSPTARLSLGKVVALDNHRVVTSAMTVSFQAAFMLLLFGPAQSCVNSGNAGHRGPVTLETERLLQSADDRSCGAPAADERTGSTECHDGPGDQNPSKSWGWPPEWRYRCGQGLRQRVMAHEFQ